MNHLPRILWSTFLGLLVFEPGMSQAGDHSPWEHQLTVYFIGASLDGKVVMKGVSADVDMGLDDILNNLEFSFMAAYRAQKDRWSLGTDVIYLGMGASGEGERIEVEVDQWMVEMNGGYEVRPFFTVLAGLRYNSLSNQLFVSETQAEMKANENWVDPLVGGRLSWPLGSEWRVHFRGDVGGFGIGSDFAWQAIPILEWMPSERLSALVAYRVIGTHYENEDDGFKYDMTVTGPSLGLSFHF